MIPSPFEQATLLGNGRGVVYITGPSGVFPTPFSSEGKFPQVGFPNGLTGKEAAYKFGKFAKRSAFGTKATWSLEVTAAAADNLTVLKVGGVSQITGAVAMVAGNVEASAIAISNAINATATAFEWKAVSRLGVVYVEADLSGTAGNNLPIQVTFSGGTTYDVNPVTGGGTNPNAYSYRVWLDTDINASVDTMGPGAVEVTEAVAAAANTPVLTTTLASTNAISVQRTESYADIKVSGGTLNDIIYKDAQDGDVIVLRGNTAAGVPVTVTNAGNIATASGSNLVLTDDKDSIMLTYRSNIWWQTAYGSTTLGEVRALSGNIPAVPGVHQDVIPAAGNYVIAPGAVFGGFNTNQCYVEFTGGLVVLAGPVNIVLTRGLVGQDLKDGDFGAIFFKQTAITSTPNVITITDTDGVVTQVINDQIASTGNYGVVWAYNGSRFSAFVVPNITASEWVRTAMIGNSQVTDAKIFDVNGTKIQPSTIPFSAADPSFQALVLGSQVYTSQLTIAAADVLALNTTPLDIVPSPGPGFKVIPFDCSVKLIYNSAAYNAGDEVGIILSGATQPVISSTTILQATLTREEKMSSFPTIGAGDTQIIPNASLQVWSPANPTLGDSDIIVTVAYKIVTD